MQQIRDGGPVTVTDPEVIRYFMTIPEASQLVLQAGCLGKGGDIFVLDMGEPVRIVTLAEDLIRLSGLTPYEEIDIVFTGLRPGEKMFEELLISGEGVMPTTHEKIKVVSAIGGDLQSVSVALDRLFELADNFNTIGIIRSLCMLVTEFKPGRRYTDPVKVDFKQSHVNYASGKKAGVFPAKVIPIRTNLACVDLTAKSQ
jgi:FlaA1/EpsC-like NDP-sugar epimerase